MNTSSFDHLNTDVGGIRDAFEEFCCQLFRRAPEVPEKSTFYRFQGSGGDGGVEAIWTYPNEEIWGIQAKFFSKIKASEKAQITESIRQAAANYPLLRRYTICLPFDLTGRKGAKSGNPKSGQHETYAQWVEEWKAELEEGGQIVEFDLWDKAELLGRLAEADPSGGLRRYWFGEIVLSETWFTQHLAQAEAQAGARYSPELTIATPLDDALQAFGRSEPWINKMEKLCERCVEKLDKWKHVAASERAGLPSNTPDKVIKQSETLIVCAERIETTLKSVSKNPAALEPGSFQETVRKAISKGAYIESKLKEILQEKYGHNADTEGFRQFRAEHQLDFPMAPLDYIRSLLDVLEEVERLTSQPEGQLPMAPSMLIQGVAGIGKTHGIVDAAIKRMSLGLRSVVLFGEDVTGPEPWHSISTKLGLSNAEGWGSLLDALNATGEASGYPLIVFIDALNETQPNRQNWQTWLPPMIEQIRQRPFLKLCVSCRDTYLREIIPNTLHVPTVVHNGFLGREYDAQFSFFQFYGLDIPSSPLLQEEFSNPLFLRLTCEALKDSGERTIPVGSAGIRKIINLFLNAKNEKAANICDYDGRENHVNAAMTNLAKAMARADRRTLPLRQAKNLVDTIPVPQSRSLFSVLETESLIATTKQPSTSSEGEPDYLVRFTFERIGDHIIAEHLISSASDYRKAFLPGGSLHYLVENATAANANAGLLEALSIQLPELEGIELIDLVDGLERPFLLKCFVTGLPWRDPAHISSYTCKLVLEALSSEIANEAFEAILSLATLPEHPLNARFLSQRLYFYPILERDPFWANMLEQSYSNWSKKVRPHSGVHRLIDSACRGNLSRLSDDSGILWAIILAWFCASPDRRIRDQATMAMVSVFRERPSAITPLIHAFARCDDEYIAERVLVAGYGALLLNQSRPHLQKVASEIYTLYFDLEEPPLNASLRDHARLIIELANDLDVSPPQAKPEKYQPPYSSRWPIDFPTEEDVKPFEEDRERFPQMQLTERFGLALGTDFARYIVEPKTLRAFDIHAEGIEKLDLFRWFLQKVVDWGYPGKDDRCALFDRILLTKFGGGRGKPKWAERLGKKYYWILLNQLVGQLSDHVSKKDWSGSIHEPSNDLQGLNLRDIDPTDLRVFSNEPCENDSWLNPSPYASIEPNSPEDDDTWVVENDLLDINKMLLLHDGNGTQWHGLDLGDSWHGKRINPKVESYRCFRYTIGSYTCDIADSNRLEKAWSDGSLSFEDQLPMDYRGYLAEYPRRWPSMHWEIDFASFSGQNAGIDLDHTTINYPRGNEWEYDHSVSDRSPSLFVPSPSFVREGDLHWDGLGSWHDSQGIIQITDPWWWSDQKSGLIICLDYLDKFLEAKGKVLAIIGLQMKFIASMYSGEHGRLIEQTLFLRQNGQTKLVKKKTQRD